MKAFLLLFLFLTACNSREKEFKFEEVGWTVKVPGEFTMLDETAIATMNNTGKEVIETQYDTSVNLAPSKTLFCLQADPLDFVSATITPCTPDYLEELKTGNTALKSFLYNTLHGQLPDAQIDTNSGQMRVGTKEFDHYQLKLTFPDKPPLHIHVYSAIVRNYDLGITVSYVDEQKGEKLRSILHSSFFEDQ